ncbi:hypothetical protein D6C91_04862 [Aureobasidium pullulans]|uniref:Uncharacterized protein n=1 Tax=Aureobasidium pullulans TaxID=5580 RepID=A0A4S9T8B7_AURPU|nr:hypothetical protein D6C91_04862 [Aureobasidium pullulans]
MCIANVRSGRSFAKPLVLSKRSSLVWKKKPIVSCFGGRMRLRSKAASSPQITPRGHVVLASLHGAHPHFLSIAGQVNSSRNKKDLGERQLLSARRALGKYSTMRNADTPSPIKGREKFSRVFHFSRWMFDTMSIDGG